MILSWEIIALVDKQKNVNFKYETYIFYFKNIFERYSGSCMPILLLRYIFSR